MYYVGIDVHMKKCVTTIKGKDRTILKQTSFNNDTNGISAFAVAVRNRYWPAKAVCESTGNYWILPYDMLSEAGLDMKLANYTEHKSYSAGKAQGRQG